MLRAIPFLARYESEAMHLEKEIGTLAGGFLGDALGTAVEWVGAVLALTPGFSKFLRPALREPPYSAI